MWCQQVYTYERSAVLSMLCLMGGTVMFVVYDYDVGIRYLDYKSSCVCVFSRVCMFRERCSLVAHCTWQYAFVCKWGKTNSFCTCATDRKPHMRALDSHDQNRRKLAGATK